MTILAQGNGDSSSAIPTYRSKKSIAAIDTTILLLALMDRTLDLLIEMTKTGEHWPELYIRGRKVLESLPLATTEFAVASQRLKNAREYATKQDFGAAAFELRMLRSQLAD